MMKWEKASIVDIEDGEIVMLAIIKTGSVAQGMESADEYEYYSGRYNKDFNDITIGGGDILPYTWFSHCLRIEPPERKVK